MLVSGVVILVMALERHASPPTASAAIAERGEQLLPRLLIASAP
jgi:hypothetical protein